MFVRQPTHVLTFPDDALRLRMRSADVESSARIDSLLETMLESLWLHEGFGIAAPQIGVPLRVVMIHKSDRSSRKGGRPALQDLLVVVNPRLATVDDETVVDYDGCLSVPGYYTRVTRPKRLRLFGFDPTGNPIEEEHEGLLAWALHHEVDHLNGKLFLDRAVSQDGLWLRPDGDFVPGRSPQSPSLVNSFSG